MPLEWYGHAIAAAVHEGRLFRHRVIVDEEQSCAALLLAQGPPRCWEMALDAAERGVRVALEQRYTNAAALLAAAAAELTNWDETMLDGNVGDVHGAALSVHQVETGQLASVATAGSCRGYQYSPTDHQRLKCSESPASLAGATFVPACSVMLKGGETFVIGPSHLFRVAGAAQMVGCLCHDQASPAALAQGLLNTSEAVRNGGAVVALHT